MWAYIAAGRPKVATGRIASFELWDDLVRQPLCWLRERLVESGRDLTDLPMFVDPADSIDRAASENPETSKLAVLLNAWIATFGSAPRHQHKPSPKRLARDAQLAIALVLQLQRCDSFTIQDSRLKGRT